MMIDDHDHDHDHDDDDDHDDRDDNNDHRHHHDDLGGAERSLSFAGQGDDKGSSFNAFVHEEEDETLIITRKHLGGDDHDINDHDFFYC